MSSPYSSVRYGSLQGRSVLITGGASGLGAAMVEAYVEQGARVAFLDIDVASGTTLLLAPARNFWNAIFSTLTRFDAPSRRSRPHKTASTCW